MSNSIGNLKNSGLQGNNFPWQLKMLQGLQAIYDETALPLTCATDSVSICAGGTPLTSTAFSPTEQALDVNVLPTYTVLNLENLEVSDADGDLSAFGPNITSISFFSNGTTNALVSVNGGSTFINVAPGTTINLDANSPSNAYGGTSFFWDTTTNLGSSLIIIYSYI